MKGSEEVDSTFSRLTRTGQVPGHFISVWLVMTWH